MTRWLPWPPQGPELSAGPDGDADLHSRCSCRVLVAAATGRLSHPTPDRRSRHLGRHDVPMTDCLFCQLAAGDIPAEILYSDDRIVAFRDVNPQAPTHVLVIPRVHFGDVAELTAEDPELLGLMVRTATDIAGRRTPRRWSPAGDQYGSRRWPDRAPRTCPTCSGADTCRGRPDDSCLPWWVDMSESTPRRPSSFPHPSPWWHVGCG